MEVTNIFKMLSDKTRLRIVVLLFQGSLCVCELEEILEVSQVNISRHLMKLKENNIVKTKRTSRRIYYYLSKKIEDDKELYTLIEKIKTENEYLVRDIKRYKDHVNSDNYYCEVLKKEDKK